MTISHDPARLASLVAALERLVEQARAYDRALPPSNYPARVAVSTLRDMARAALDEARELQAALGAPVAHPLSPRELEVLTLATAGLANKEIAARLGVSDRTVQFHMNSVFAKTGTSSRTEAASHALRQGWLRG